MSVTTLSSEPNKLHKISSQFRKKSGELDVFEAARYFSGANEHRRMSLDVSIPAKIQPLMEKEQIKERTKKFKQPSSPGGRIASFLNSLFNQTSSKKKSKSKPKDVEEDCNGGRRKRRSSISHFRVTTHATNASTEYSSSASGFRTPPPYNVNTPSKSYKDFRIFSDQFKKVVSLPNYNEQKRTEPGSFDEKSRVKNGISQKIMKNVTVGFEEREYRKFDDGGESDSSSDLFDLPNLDLDSYPTGLPVYETTHMDRIKIGSKQIPSYPH